MNTLSLGPDLALFVDSRSPLPLYAQLKEQLRFLILKGDIPAGTRLPSTRALANFLRINRNTAAAAYQELIRESLVEVRPGNGCYVKAVDRPAGLGPGAAAALLRLADEAISRAVELGATPMEFATAVHLRARAASVAATRRRPGLAFVECQQSIAEGLAAQLSSALGLPVTPLTLSDLTGGRQEVLSVLQGVRLVATTFFHIYEVRRLLPRARPEVVGLVVKPHLEGLLKLSRIDAKARVLLVCLSPTCAADMARSIENAGLKGRSFDLAGVDDPEDLRRRVKRADVVVASNNVSGVVEPLVDRARQTLVSLDYSVIDEAAVAMLKARLEALESTVPGG